MGSASSSQVRNIDAKTNKRKASAGTLADVSGKEAIVTMTTSKSVGRTVSNPNAPDTGDSQNPEPSAAMMALKPASSQRHSSGDVGTHSATRQKSTAASSAATSDLELKLAQLQKELNESESEKLDLNDRIQALEERLQELMTSAAAPPGGGERRPSGAGSSVQTTGSDLHETLHAKDLYIQQMEKQLATTEAKSKKVRIRLKKKIKALSCQLNEARQESSISQLELKEHNADLREQLRHSTEGKASQAAARKTSAEDDDDNNDKDSKMKVILDLSAELSEHTQHIAALERQLKEKDREVEQLKQGASLSHPPRCSVDAVSNSNNNHSNSHFQQHHESSSQAVGLASQWQQHGPSSRHTKLTGPAGRSGVAPVETTASDYYRMGGGGAGLRPVSKITAKRGPAAHHHRVQEEELTLQRQSTALSDSDSDWEVEMSPSKIHSAPARVRVERAAMLAEEKPANPHADVEDKWSIATDDNDLTLTSEAGEPRQRGSSGSNNTRQKRKSALKTRLERERDERARGLMGPSLAFAAPASDQLSDISCTPPPATLYQRWGHSSSPRPTSWHSPCEREGY